MVHSRNSKEITILIPVYNEESGIEELVRRLNEVTDGLSDYRFRYLFVDDGSRDGTVDLLLKMEEGDHRIQLIQLSRNFGKEIALTAGIDHVKSDALVIMDADLQHPPSMIPEFIRAWEEGYEVVSTRRVSIKKQPLLRRFSSYLFYTIFNSISDIKMISQTTDFRLIDRVVIDALKEFRERNRMVRGIIDWMGFHRTVLDFEASERFSGKAGYSYFKLIRLAINTFTSFSLFPLKAAGYLGILLMSVVALGLLYMVIDNLFLHWGYFTTLAFVVMANTFLIGLVLSSLGLIALYIGNIHVEVLNRPLYLIREKRASSPGASSAAKLSKGRGRTKNEENRVRRSDGTA